MVGIAIFFIVFFIVFVIFCAAATSWRKQNDGIVDAAAAIEASRRNVAVGPCIGSYNSNSNVAVGYKALYNIVK